MTDKSLGQVAYEAHASAKGWQRDWKRNPDQAAWQAAAEAVAFQAWAEGYSWGYSDAIDGVCDVNDRENPYKKEQG